MVLGAILVVGAGDTPEGESRSLTAPGATLELPLPFSRIEILGRSTVDRIVERFVAADVERVTVLIDSRASGLLPPLCCDTSRVSLQPVEELHLAVTQTLQNYCETGVDYALVSTAAAYTECDFIDLLWFHRGSRQAITRVVNHRSELDLWIVDCKKSEPAALVSALAGNEASGSASYMVSEYTSRIDSFRGVRQFALDIFNRRCSARPWGKEVRPGVWIGNDADVHKRSRIVAPAYIGQGSKICEDTVITRSSTIESSCHVDYGTVIEDSSVLADSYIGIWLDVTHAVVSGNRLFNLSRDIDLDIADASVLRPNLALHSEVRNTSVRGDRSVVRDDWAPSKVDSQNS